MNQYYKLVFLNMLRFKDVYSSLILRNVSNNLMIIKSVAFKKNLTNIYAYLMKVQSQLSCDPNYLRPTSIFNTKTYTYSGQIEIHSMTDVCYMYIKMGFQEVGWAVAYRGEGLGCSTHPPEIQKSLQNRAKLNPTVKTVKNC